MTDIVEHVARAIWETRRKGRLRGHAGLHLTWDEIANPEALDINPFRLTELAADIRDEATATLAALHETPDGMVGNMVEHVAYEIAKSEEPNMGLSWCMSATSTLIEAVIRLGYALKNAGVEGEVALVLNRRDMMALDWTIMHDQDLSRVKDDQSGTLRPSIAGMPIRVED